jgi:hypothetical protein
MSGETRWTEAVDEFFDATGKRLAVFAGLSSIRTPSEEMAGVQEQLAAEIASNIFQFVERHGAQGGKHAEDQSRPGAEARSLEPHGDAPEASRA